MAAGNQYTHYTQFQSRVFAGLIYEISPKLYKASLKMSQPLLVDLKHLSFIVNSIRSDKGDPNPENLAFYCAVIFKLYSPLHLFIKEVKLKAGYRKAFCNALSIKWVEEWNRYSIPVQSHMLNRRFANEVNDLAFTICDQLKDKTCS